MFGVEIIIIIIITIIIIIIISFMQGAYTHIPETNYVPREHGVAAILLFLFMVLILLLLLLLLLLLTAIELPLAGSSPYTNTNKTDMNKCT